MLKAVKDPATKVVLGFRDTEGEIPETVFPVAALADRAVIRAGLKRGLSSSKGPIPMFHRDTTSATALPHIVDNYGLLRGTCNGEQPSGGSRREENFLRYANNLTFTGSDGWTQQNSATVLPASALTQRDAMGEPRDYILSRAAQANSALVSQKGLHRPRRNGPFDLLSAVPHFVGLAMRQLPGDTNAVELRVYIPGGAVIETDIITIDQYRRRYAIKFTPERYKKATAWSWTSSVLTLTVAGHGYTNGSTVKLSGFVASNAVSVDGSYTVASVPTADTFTVALASDPATMSTAGRTQPQYRFGVSPISFASTGAGSIQVGEGYLSECPDPIAAPGPWLGNDDLPNGIYWNEAGVEGVAYYDTENANTWDPATFIVTERPEGGKLSTPKGVMTFGSHDQWITDNDTPSTKFSSLTGVTLTEFDGLGPDGVLSMTKMTEDTGASAHQIAATISGMTTYDDVWLQYDWVIKYQGVRWMRLVFIDLAGATNSMWIDVQNGVIGTTQIGYGNVEKLANGNFRFMWQVPSGNGNTDPILRLAFATADNSTSTYTGTSRYNWIGFPVLTTGVGSASQRPTPSPFFYSRGAVARLGGCLVFIPTAGRLNRTNIAIQSTWTPYFDLAYPNRQLATAAWYLVTQAPALSYEAFNSYLNSRMGPTVRSIVNSGDSGTRIAFDLYFGEVNRFYVWRAGKNVKAGDWVIPTAMKPFNLPAPSLKQYLVMNDGVLGATEPGTWPTTNGATVTNGTVTLKQAALGLINGDWEPYQNFSELGTLGFMGVYRLAETLRDLPDASAFVNGKQIAKESPNWPVSPAAGGSLQYAPKAILLGTVQTSALPPAIGLGLTSASFVGTHGAFHKDLFAWNDSIDDDLMAAFNALAISA